MKALIIALQFAVENDIFKEQTMARVICIILENNRNDIDIYLLSKI